MKIEQLNSIIAQLVEHFDAVQLLVSVTEEGRTSYRAIGAGNWYARQGMAHEFINADVAQVHAAEIAEKLEGQ